MAKKTNSPSWQEWYGRSKGSKVAMSMADATKPRFTPVAGVYDPYSNTYYGEARSKESWLRPLTEDISKLTAFIEKQDSHGYISDENRRIRDNPFNPTLGWLFAIHDRLNQHKRADPSELYAPIAGGQSGLTMKDVRESLVKMQEMYSKFDSAEYKYQDRMQDSIEAYGEDWGKFFEGNFKNPRLSEEQANRINRGQQRVQQRQQQYEDAAQLMTSANSGLLIPPKTSKGTGLGRSTGDTGFTGLLDTGLGL